MTSQITSPAANVELMRAGFQAFNAGDADECLAHMAPDFVINLAELPEPQHGREVWRQGFEMMRHAFPDLQAHVEDIFAAQDKVAVRLRFRGTHSGEFLGFRPTGRTYPTGRGASGSMPSIVKRAASGEPLVVAHDRSQQLHAGAHIRTGK